MADTLTRDGFRDAVFKRDQGYCVICNAQAQDAHHIIERRLFLDGGYYLNNGASLCAKHHLEAEMTTLSVGDIRIACGISESQKVIPDCLYPDQIYDKWGNPILDSGQRSRGGLFDDPNIQKILQEGGVLDLFTHYVKYPRTFHLPFSASVNPDDRILKSASFFEGELVVITVKMDGENTTMYNDYIHARSLTASRHPSRSWVKNFHSKIAFEIPDGWRICGESLFAEHSIAYHNLYSFFYGFSIWNDQNICLSWDDTLEFFALLGIIPVPVLYEGIWDEVLVRDLYDPMYDGCECEGFVVRKRSSFSYRDFPCSVAKYVRRNHISNHDLQKKFHRGIFTHNKLRA